MQEKELWKSVGMFRGIDFSSYESSTFGNVRSIDRDVKYKDGEFIKEYCSLTDAAKEMNVIRQAIQQCTSGRMKTCKGYKWEYK